MFERDTEGLSPQNAAVLMGVLALLGLGFFGLVHLLNQKSADGLYDFQRPEQRTSAGVQMTPDAWKRKGSEAQAEPPQQPQATPATPQPQLPPVIIKRQPEEAPAKPPSTEPAR